jgi:superoxide dismutase, Cu-Zn family
MERIVWTLPLLVTAAIGVAACGGSETPPTLKRATALLKDKMGTQFGSVVFTQNADGTGPMSINIAIATTSTHATAGDHGMHIHAGGACDAPDFMTAMGHWNPTMAMHGNPTAGAHHGGDLGNITINANAGAKDMTTTEMSLTTGQASSIVGLAVIVHQNPDDYVTQMPPGNAGPRIACGVISLQ